MDTCHHKEKRVEICDVIIRSRNNVMVMDVPCETCTMCRCIVQIGPIHTIVLEMASLNPDGKHSRFTMTAQSIVDRDESWNGCCVRFQAAEPIRIHSTEPIRIPPPA